MIWGQDLSIEDLLTLKPAGFYRIETIKGRQVISIFRPDEPVERIVCASPGHANQVRIALSEEGLAGYVEGAR